MTLTTIPALPITFEEKFCECGQYLTKYLYAISCGYGNDTIIWGVPCPNKDCNATFTIEKKTNVD